MKLKALRKCLSFTVRGWVIQIEEYDFNKTIKVWLLKFLNTICKVLG